LKGERRLKIGVDWDLAPKGEIRGDIQIQGAVNTTVSVTAENSPVPPAWRGFVEADGYVSLEAEHGLAVSGADGAQWSKIPDYGRTLSGMTPTPSTYSSFVPGQGPRLEYRMFLSHSGKVKVSGIFGPSLAFDPAHGLRVGVSFDDQTVKVIDVAPVYLSRDWEKAVSDSVREVSTELLLERPGAHTLKIWAIDPGVVLEKLVVDLGGVRPSYLGPPESYRQ
jgi:hypothetical protein